MDGMGSFNISIKKSKKQKIGWSVKPEFLIELDAQHFALLKEIQIFFGVGQVTGYNK